MTVTRTLAAAGLAVMLAGCTALNQSREPDPTQVRLDSLERRLEAIERILANGSLVDLTLEVDELSRQTAELQGRLERLEYGQEGAAERQRTLYADLDDRLQSLESNLQQAASSLPAASGQATALPVPGGSDQDNYQAAFGFLREQKYDQAADAFAQFLAAFPDSSLAANAQYWLAESHYVTNQFERALGEFQQVIDRHPRSQKVPDALLKVGFCNYELERWPDARIALSRVRAEYPDTSAASLADQRLARMQQEGH